MKKNYLIAAALLAVCGCQKSNESPVVTGKADKILAYVEDNADTKTIATPSADGKSLDFVWAKGDKIGVVTASTDVNDWGYYDKNTKKYVPFEYTLDGEGGSKVGTFSTEKKTIYVPGIAIDDYKTAWKSLVDSGWEVKTLEDAKNAGFTITTPSTESINF